MPNRSGGARSGLRSIARAFPVLLTTMLGTIAGLVLLSVVGFEIHASVRAYVNGEGEWSKAQRDAVAALLEYVREGDRVALRAYHREIAVNLHDRAAREALDRPVPDIARARAGFLGGRNHPDDVPRLIRLFRVFRHEHHVDQAIAIWAEADVHVARLEQLARDAEAAHRRVATPDEMRALAEQLHAINARLAPLEREFSGTVGAASRWVHGLLVAAIVAAGGILLCLGGGTAYLLLRDLSRSQEALVQSRQEQVAIVESALDGVVAMDHEGRIVAFNSAAERMFGVPRQEAIGREMITVIAPPEMWEPHRRGLAAHLATGAHVRVNRRVEVTAARRDGSTFPVELAISRVAGVTPPRFTGFMRDLTERREAEARLLHAQKLETVGRLAGGVAHDFNNVLTAILGFSEMLHERLTASRVDTFEVGQIATAAERARSLTAQLLAFSRKQLLTLESLSLKALVAESVPLIERLIGEQIVVTLDLDPAERPVRADVGQLQQVLLNRAVNARDAMAHGGVLTIVTRLDADGMRLTVADTGCGMTPETQARIFEPFFTTKGPARGTGLGLATVYGTISQLGGQITVESQVNAGTRFHIVLPVRAAEAHPTPPPPALAAPPRARGGACRILVVEDERAVRDLVSRALTRRGYAVEVACSAEEALERLQCDPGGVDLLLSDIVMPGMNGHALATKLRTDRPSLKVVLMSGYAEEEVRRQTTGAAVFTMLRKPFTMAQLHATVADAVQGEVMPIAS